MHGIVGDIRGQAIGLAKPGENVDVDPVAHPNVPALVNHQGWKRCLARHDEVQDPLKRLERPGARAIHGVNRRVTGGKQADVADRRRNIEGLGQTLHHAAGRQRPTGLEKGKMPARYPRVAGQRELAKPPMPRQGLGQASKHDSIGAGVTLVKKARRCAADS